MPFFLNPGVQLEFEPFTLSEPFERTYSIEALPAVHDQVYFVQLVVYDPGELKIESDSPIRFGLSGFLEIEAVTVSGHAVFRERWSPEETGWSASGPPLVALAGTIRTAIPASVVKSSDPPQAIRISWVPSTGVLPKKAALRLRAGGTT